MYDLDAVRKRVEEYSLEELMKEALLKSADYEEEPLEVLRSELARRTGDIETLLEQEREVVGEEIARVKGAREFCIMSGSFDGAMEKGVFDGELLLCAKGCGFLAADWNVEPSHGLLGFVTAQITKKLKGDANAARHADFPVSLLAGVLPSAFWCPAESIERVELEGGETVMFLRGAEGAAKALIPPEAPALIRRWGEASGVSVVVPQHVGLWASLKGLFSKG